MRQHLQGILWLITFSFTDSFLLNVIRHVSPLVHTFQLLFVGNLVAAILAYLWVIKARAGFRTQNLKLHFSRVCFETIAASIMFYSLSIMQAAEVRSIMFLTPVFASIVAIFILGEKSTKQKWLVLIAGFIGVLIILRPDAQVVKITSLMPILSSLFFSFGLNILKKTTGNDPPMRVAFYFTTLQSLVALPLVIYFWKPITHEAAMWLVGIGVLFFLCHVTITNAMAAAPLTVLAPFIFLGLIFTACIGYVMNGEFPGINVFIGGVVIVAAVSYTAFREAKKG